MNHLLSSCPEDNIELIPFRISKVLCKRKLGGNYVINYCTPPAGTGERCAHELPEAKRRAEFMSTPNGATLYTGFSALSAIIETLKG